MTRGSVETLNRRFDVERGTIVFSGPARDAVADVLATMNVRTDLSVDQPAVEINLYFQGRLSRNPEIRLTSVRLIEAMPRATELLVFKILAPLALFWNPASVRNWLFDREGEQFALDRAGLDPWVGAVAILLTAVATAVIAHRRYRRDF